MRLSDKQISEQESLNIKRLNNITSSYNIKSPRPAQSLVELMRWAGEYVTEQTPRCGQTKSWIPFIHNKISADGSFFQFCEESGIEIQAIHTDAITSWQSDQHDEHFVGVGIFKVNRGDLEFYHCGLFHKGNQNEDEVSFFVLIQKDDFERYISLRNEYEAWENKRERDSQEIEVIGGESIPYDPNASWDDVFLAGNLKDMIKITIDGFLSSKATYERLKVPWRRGIGFWGNRGCHAKGTGILMYDGSIKSVEDIVIGDRLIGPDSQPREVLKLVRGSEEMFKVTPTKAKPFVVNKNHILHLRCRRPRPTVPQKINITVSDFIGLTKNAQKNNYQMCLSDVLEFDNNSNLILDPYFLGIWLGDGNSSSAAVTTADPEIDAFVCEFAAKYSCNISRYKSVPMAKCDTLYISNSGNINPVVGLLRQIGVLDNKHIPKQYLVSSIKNRLELLAGIIDTDGCYSSISWRGTEKLNKKGTGYKGYFEVLQKSEQLTNDIVFLVKSLGLQISVRKCNKTIKSTNFSGTYFRMNIFGSIEKIPVKIPRKKAIAGRPNKAPLIRGITSVESVGVGDYYGFVIDKDHLYLDSEFFIHHNCGKTKTLGIIMAQYTQLKPVTIQSGHSTPDELLEEAFEYAEQHAPALLFFEDLQEMIKTVDARHFLQLLDGLQRRDGILTIVTGNDFSALEENIKSRPRRFDRFFEFPLPDIEQANKYLNRYLVDILPSKKIESIAKRAVKNKFTYAHLQELYFNAVFIAIPEGREIPSASNVNLSFRQVLKEKKSADGDFLPNKRGLTDDDVTEDDDDDEDDDREDTL